MKASEHNWCSMWQFIRPLSGTSSFSNDTVWFTNFFVDNGDRICLSKSIILGGIKISIDRVFPLLVLLGNRKKPTLIFTVTVFTIICKTYNHRCQQMQRNYFRITKALCHLMAVLTTIPKVCSLIFLQPYQDRGLCQIFSKRRHQYYTYRSCTSLYTSTENI